jgi:23S rRNA pseudoU1915 N3-methylase RlmH
MQDILDRVKLIQEANGGGKAPAIPLIDPTANVTALVLSVEKRLDDARSSDAAHNAEIRRLEQHCATEVSELREKLAEAQLQRIDALALAEKTRIDAKISQGEQNVALTAERTTAQAAALATAVSASAEALRLAAQQQNDVTTKAIRILEQNQYQSGGRDEQRTQGRATAGQTLYIVFGAGGFIIALAALFLRATGH